jgi:hypothetical protein
VDVLADWEGMVMVPIPTLAKNVIFITYPQSPNLLVLIKKRIVHVIMYLVRFLSVRNLGKPCKKIRKSPQIIYSSLSSMGAWRADIVFNTTMNSKLCTHLLLLFSSHKMIKSRDYFLATKNWYFCRSATPNLTSELKMHLAPSLPTTKSEEEWLLSSFRSLKRVKGIVHFCFYIRIN